jgi:O-antigen ligase
MFRDHPLAGVGLGNWPIAFPSYARYDDGLFANQAHNDWAQAAAEAGIPGLAAFALFFVLTVRQARHNPWCLGLVFVFLHAAVDYPFHKPQIAALVCILLSMRDPWSPLLRDH